MLGKDQGGYRLLNGGGAGYAPGAEGDASVQGMPPSLMGRELECGNALPTKLYNFLIQNDVFCVMSAHDYTVHRSYSNVKRKKTAVK